MTDNDIKLASTLPKEYLGYPVVGISRSKLIIDRDIADQLSLVIEANKELWMGLNFVSGVSRGFKSFSGFYDYSKPCIIFYVRKNASPDLSVIPKSLSLDPLGLVFDTSIELDQSVIL